MEVKRIENEGELKNTYLTYRDQKKTIKREKKYEARIKKREMKRTLARREKTVKTEIKRRKIKEK